MNAHMQKRNIIINMRGGETSGGRQLAVEPAPRPPLRRDSGAVLCPFRGPSESPADQLTKSADSDSSAVPARRASLVNHAPAICARRILSDAPKLAPAISERTRSRAPEEKGATIWFVSGTRACAVGAG